MKRSYVIHMGLVSLFAGMVWFVGQHIEALQAASPLFFLLGGFATFRMARTISYNGVMDWLRAPFTQEVEDSSGAGMSVEPKRDRKHPKPFIEVIGDLICCPICSGTWSALFIALLYSLDQRIGWAVVLILGLAGVSEVIHWASEMFEWAGRNQRELSGEQLLWKTRHVVKPAPNSLEQDEVQTFRILG